MSGLCGWIGQGADMGDGGAIVSMPAPQARLQPVVPRSKTVALGGVTLAVRPGDGDFYSDNQGDVAAIWGKVKFADGELAQVARCFGAARAIAQGFSRSGAEVVRDLSGSFALAILSSKSREAVLATDHLGIHPLFYTVDQGPLVFGSSLDSIAEISKRKPQIDPQAIFHYVYFHMVPGPRTIYAGLRRLPAASLLIWRNGEAVTRSYRHMRFIENEKRSFAELKSEFIGLLRNGVLDAAQEGGVGAFLSGGTDSSTIAGMLREVTRGAPAYLLHRLRGGGIRRDGLRPDRRAPFRHRSPRVLHHPAAKWSKLSR